MELNNKLKNLLSRIYTRKVAGLLVAVAGLLVIASFSVDQVDPTGEGDAAAVNYPAKKKIEINGKNLITNGNLEEGSDNNPVGWNQGGWGTNDRVFTYPVDGSSGQGAKVEIANYTDGDAKWYFDDVTVTPGEEYTFSHFYTANLGTTLVLEYTMTDGTLKYKEVAKLQPSSVWKQHVFTFIAPENAVSATVLHILSGVGQLTIDDYHLYEGNAAAFDRGKVSFSFDDGWLEHYTIAKPVLDDSGLKGTFYIITNESINGVNKSGSVFEKIKALFKSNSEPSVKSGQIYVNTEQIRSLSENGHEIGAHTRSHAHLTSLNHDQQLAEISGSKEDLARVGFEVTTIAYPYGDFNSEIEKMAGESEYLLARSTKRGYNDGTTDPLSLKVQQIDRNTSLEEMLGWVDFAAENRVWLIFMFHQISDDESLGLGIDEEAFRGLVEYTSKADVDVITVAEGAELLYE
ncbi:MAG: polysaccharide deacetylase family protein [Candidatus Nomurabacteria bacterium]|nr:polysaccharide deacetylase family protein [Candidatus Nomurabacteria bacterium]USN88020.1 MAG: polysaccharide deacetylase family protein [Candidatus Nomurabacteria bacterium]